MKKHNKNRHNVERIGAAQLGADKTRILILGGGFAGVEAARASPESSGLSFPELSGGCSGAAFT